MFRGIRRSSAGGRHPFHQGGWGGCQGGGEGGRRRGALELAWRMAEREAPGALPETTTRGRSSQAFLWCHKMDPTKKKIKKILFHDLVHGLPPFKFCPQTVICLLHLEISGETSRAFLKNKSKKTTKKTTTKKTKTETLRATGSEEGKDFCEEEN